MGYNLHITRADKFYRENQGREISAQEWLEVVSKDPELSMAGFNGAYCALWRPPSTDFPTWLDWSGGNLYSKNPTPSMIEKMIEIASRLNGRVQGDDGEYYLPDGGVERDGKMKLGPDWDWRRG